MTEKAIQKEKETQAKSAIDIILKKQKDIAVEEERPEIKRRGSGIFTPNKYNESPSRRSPSKLDSPQKTPTGTSEATNS